MHIHEYTHTGSSAVPRPSPAPWAGGPGGMCGAAGLKAEAEGGRSWERRLGGVGGCLGRRREQGCGALGVAVLWAV
eukprot:scaffold15012_cov58-Phaeocystis_antarctica.AAC.4